MPRRQRQLVLILPCLAVWLGAGDRVAADAARPNVVLIMTDDQGYGDLGATGNPVIKTPNIDAMARRSATMETFYVSPVCAPTRACLMTGRYNYRTRCIDTYIGRAMMDPDEVTVAEILREAGYATGIFGKWHLGDCYPMRPMDQGFETSLVHRGGGIGQPSDPPGGEGKYTNPILFRNGKQEQMEGYCTDVYYENAIEFIKTSKKEERPFFVYLPDNCPHGPFGDVPQDEYESYKKMNLDNDQFPQDQGHPLPKQADADKRARIFAMITNVDKNVGRLFASLESLGLTENTIVIFMVDNGPNGRRYVAGMRGNKSHVHEGGIRSPFFMHWPAQLKAGTACATPSAHIDVLPTLLDACNVARPDGLELDGRSMLLELKGAKVKRRSRTIYIQSHRGDHPVLYHNFAARNEMWKLVHPSGFGRESFSGEPKLELYNMLSDPLEMNNVADQHSDVVARMKGDYEAWFRDVSSTRPDNYAPPRIHVGTPHENPTVLTRQDWRHTQGRPWQRDSAGHWLLYVASSGTYDIRCRFDPSDPEGEAVLKVEDSEHKLALPAGASTCLFEGIKLKEGNLRLEVVMTHAGKRRGIHQADVIRRKTESRSAE
ncbi:MAG: arylsulfatase [Planctomycetes bacterium]|nr:arylsulfatase [Planctomycetota bacterium]